MLRVHNLKKTFGSKHVVADISFTIDHGHIAVFLGSSGVGKSTLLRILNNLESVDSGTITLDDKPLDIQRVNQDHTVGMVFQQSNLFDHLTIEENITLALIHVMKKTSQEARAIAHTLLAKYNLLDQAQKYPAQLSGGQKQRVAIIRTLAMKPKIICFDEPTSALDPLLTNYVAQNIQELASEGYIILIATHDTAILDKLDATIYLMQDGHIIETANTKQFIRTPSAYQLIQQFVSGEKKQNS
jgi:ABC-type polar amino acid transport system ATPase subunit